jgi:hypothetical protein
MAQGHAELLRRLREPAEVEITDRNSFLILLAFLGRQPDPLTRRARGLAPGGHNE